MQTAPERLLQKSINKGIKFMLSIKETITSEFYFWSFIYENSKHTLYILPIAKRAEN